MLIALAACTVVADLANTDSPPPHVDPLRESVATLEESAADATYRAVLPAEMPPLLSQMGLSRAEETGFVLAFTHDSRQSFLWHAADEDELLSCAELDAVGDPGDFRCVRRETEGPRPFLVYLVTPEADVAGPSAPTTAALIEYWENVPITFAPAEPAWFTKLAGQ